MKRVLELEEEIQLNFSILMAITSMMAVVLVMTLHACYVACKQRVDDALQIPVAKLVASRVPIVRPNVEAPCQVEISRLIEMEIRNQITLPT